MACRRIRAVLREEFGRAVAGGILFPLALTILTIREPLTCIFRRADHLVQIVRMQARRFGSLIGSLMGILGRFAAFLTLVHAGGLFVLRSTGCVSFCLRISLPEHLWVA